MQLFLNYLVVIPFIFIFAELIVSQEELRMPRFILNDGTKNAHGFRIPTSGINLDRFKRNPVMLDDHYRSTSAVLGKWEDIEVADGILSAKPVFDMEDENAAKIAGKVERGFLNATSMGINFSRDNFRMIEDELVLEACELFEASIVAVPSNSNALRLYMDGKLLEENEIEELCLSFGGSDPNPKQISKPNETNMKIQLKPAVLLSLGFPAGTTEVDQAELEAKINQLSAEKQAAELKLAQKVEAEEQAKLAAIKAEVAQAVKDGKITADKADQFENLGIANHELMTETLASIPVKASLGAQVKPGGKTEVKTPDDFQKLTLEEQLAFKETQPEAYKALFTRK